MAKRERSSDRDKNRNPNAAPQDGTVAVQGGRGGAGGKTSRTGRRGGAPQSRTKYGKEEVLVINRCDKVTKGGKRSRFGAFVVLGDAKGKVGFGSGKAKQVPSAIEKAVRSAEKGIVNFPVVNGTIPHEVEASFGASTVRLMPAAEGTGVIAGKTVRNILEKLGIRNALSKSYGSTNPVNLTKATFKALGMLKTKEQYEQLRGVKL